MNDIARGNFDSGTSRIASAAAIDQNPPSATPSITRAVSNGHRLSATTASALDSTSSVVSASITCLRSMRRVSSGIDGAAMAPIRAVAVTVCPAAPSLMDRSEASAVSRLAGRNSAVTRPNTPSASAPTAAQRAGTSSPAMVGEAVSASGEPGSSSRPSAVQSEQEGEDTGEGIRGSGRAD